ncbi:hypothetical protein [Sorangium sp. So ce388]|uniref:hypothetical protein n=1 Tax=Sorangium sp. So ce388 TaxID=3133309 RepID=UPI003F5C1C55
MGVYTRLRGPRWLVGYAVLALVAALGFGALRETPLAGRALGREATAASAVSSPGRMPPRDGAPHSGASVVHEHSATDEHADAHGSAALARSAADAPEDAPEDAAGRGYPVDLERLRAQLPDNLYWQLDAPTDDPRVLQARTGEQKRWEDLFGKVQSNTASEEEVRRYYEHSRRVSEDYIQLASLVLAQHRDELPERDEGLYELSIQMHRSRLAEIPRHIESALARAQAQDRARDEWHRSAGRE